MCLLQSWSTSSYVSWSYKRYGLKCFFLHPESSLNLESYSEPHGGSLKALYLPLNSLLAEKPREKRDVYYLFL